MDDNDWIKFGYKIWSAHHGNLRTQILQRFKMAWSRISNSDPPLVNGAPPDLLNDPLYYCYKPVPWRIECNFPPDDVESSSRPSSPIPEPIPPIYNNSKDQAATTSNLHDDLVQVFNSLDYVIDHSGTFSKIKNGFLPGFVEYIAENHPKTRLKVIFPIIPQYCHISSNDQSFDMTSVSIDKKDAEAILEVEPKCLSLSKDQSKCRPKVRYNCFSWVCLPINLSVMAYYHILQLCIAFEMLENSHLWDIEFMNWKSFSSALLTRSGLDWTSICSADLLVGGINFINNFLYVVALFDMFFISCIANISETSSYGLTPLDTEKAWSSTLCLTSIMTIWPDPRDQLMAGSKLFVETMIQEASSFASLSHPQVAEVEPSVEIVRQITSGNLSAVLKREFSSHGHHICKPNTSNALGKLKRLLEEEENVYSQTDVFPRPRWFLCPYNPCLIHLGEIRAFVINGVLFMSVITIPRSKSSNTMDVVEPILFTPLSKLR
jgi:hypothetical protein